MMARKPIAYVQAAWHTDITEHCKQAFAAVCASGLVVDGGIYRHDFVAHAVLQGIMRTSLETEVPVLSELAEACVSIVEKLAGLEVGSEAPRHGAH